MNKVVNERRGAIFGEEESTMNAAMEASARSSKVKGGANSLFGARNSNRKWKIKANKHTQAIMKNIIQI